MSQPAQVDRDPLTFTLDENFDRAMPFALRPDIHGLEGYEVKKDNFAWYVKSPKTGTILTMTKLNQEEVNRVLNIFESESDNPLTSGVITR